MTHLIVLSENEDELFKILLKCVIYSKKSTILRVAGGWVRDKLLRRESSDIDIALSDQSGIEFAVSVNEYLSSLQMPTRTIACIQANPDQSKHLETANVRVLGFEIDCVNLRAETYCDSRIPEVRIGTALEDALRRDFTINALFYNLNTKEVEDLTGCGISDLRTGVMRTPISPFITFIDDPLRVLRAVRFASRFNFCLHEEMQAAARSKDIHNALLSKVSRERVYKECDGAICGCSSIGGRPYMAIHLMHSVVLPVSSVLKSFPIKDSSSYDHNSVVDSNGNYHEAWLQKAMESAFWVNILLSVDMSNVITDDTVASAYSEATEETVVYVVTASSQAEPKLDISKAVSNTTSISGITSEEVEGSSTSESIHKQNQYTLHLLQQQQQQQQRRHFVKYLFWSSLVIGDLCELVVIEKKKPVAFVPILFRESLKMETVSIKNIQIMLDCSLKLIKLANKWAEIDHDTAKNNDSCNNDSDNVSGGSTTTDETMDRVTLLLEEAGMSVLRECKDMWRDCILLACAFSLAQRHHPHTATTTTSVLSEEEDEADGVIIKNGNKKRRSSTNYLQKQQHDMAMEVNDEILGADDDDNNKHEDCSKNSNKMDFSSNNSNSAEEINNDQIFKDTKLMKADIAIIKRFAAFERAIELSGLDNIWAVKPLMNGTELMTEIVAVTTTNIPRKGPIVGKLLELQMRWQMRSVIQSNNSRQDFVSADKNKQDCIAYLKRELNYDI